MKISKLPKIAVIEATSADDFQDRFNSKVEELICFDDLNYQLQLQDSLYRAVITYTETTRDADTVKDEFHFEGIRFLCKHCPYLEDPKDKRVKHCKCKYAELGMTHKDHEACEMFYRKVKAGSIEPLEDYMR